MYCLGINSDEEYVKVALLGCNKRKITIYFLQEFRKDLFDINQLKKRISIETGVAADCVEIASPLSSEDVFIRHIDLPIKNKRAILKILPSQIEPMLPFSQEHSITLPIIFIDGKKSCTTLYSCLNETIESHIQDISKLGFDSDCVSTVQTAILRFVGYFSNNVKSFVVFHFGWEKSYLLYIRDKDVKQSGVIKIGLKNFINAIQLEYPDSNEIDFKILQKEILKNSDPNDCRKIKKILNDIKTQSNRIIESFLKKESFDDIDGILYTGHSDVATILNPVINDNLSQLIDIDFHLEFNKEQISSFAIEIGVALDFLEKDNHTLQFRTNQFVSNKYILKIKKKMKMFIVTSLLISAITFASIAPLLVKREFNIRDKFNKISQSVGGSVYNSPFIGRFFLNHKEYMSSIETIVKKIKNKDDVEYFTKPPLLFSYCLQRLADVVVKDVSVIDVEYQLDKYPRIGSLKEQYQVLFSLKFTAANKQLAKQFYDDLFTSVKDVLACGEMIACEENNVYKINFCCKKKPGSLCK